MITKESVFEGVETHLIATLTAEKDERQCEARCPTHGTQCKLKNFEQQAYPMHAHSQDGKMCLWKK